MRLSDVLNSSVNDESSFFHRDVCPDMWRSTDEPASDVLISWTNFDQKKKTFEISNEVDYKSALEEMEKIEYNCRNSYVYQFYAKRRDNASVVLNMVQNPLR